MARVLIVDDSAAERELLSLELEKAGHEVLAAQSGADGLRQARALAPDCILLDVLMPGMDGFETCRRLKSDPVLAPIPVLMWTSLDSHPDVVRGLEAGAHDYVTKPFVSAVLRARIRSALRAKEDRDALIDTNRRLEDAQRSATHALNVRNEFLSHVSHELRTPLSTLHQFLGIVLDGLAGPLAPEQREYLEICQRNAKQLRSMIGDLMDVTRLQNGKLRVAPRPLALAEVVQGAVRDLEPLAEAKGIALSCHCDPIPDALGDEVRIRQVLDNLVDNALKYTPEGGRVEVLVGIHPKHPGSVCVSVRDTGCGVPREARRRIFEYMQQEGDDDWRSRKGLGIGLYICRELVSRQRGRIWVESEPGKGSVFCFTLPLFDLARLIEPVMLDATGLRASWGLVRVDLAPAEPRRSRGLPEALGRRTYHLVKTSLYPSDVLLPRFFRSGDHETYFAVAATDAAGVRSLCSRIRSRLGPAELRPSEARVSVRGLAETVPEALRRLPAPDAVAALAAAIDERTRSESGWDEIEETTDHEGDLG